MRALQSSSCFVGLLPGDRNSRILDLGCGVGHLLYLLKQKGFVDIRGVDACPGAVARARQMLLPVERADIFEFLKAADQTFDCIIAVDVIEHLTKQQASDLLGLIWSRLRREGTVICQTINGESPWCQSYYASDLTHETLFTPRSLRSLLEIHGFSEVSASEVPPPLAPLRHLSRHLAWKVLRILYASWSFVETGVGISGIYSRNFVIRAHRL
jgi:2-polyprenyl-3-methyl-5-hydroxy-6-metoxy-1,4-benzoquinol methylase